MSLSITSKQMDVTPSIRQFIEEKLAKLDKLHTTLINPHFTLSKEPDGFVVDATIQTKGSPIVASAKYEDMYTAIIEVVDKLEKQINKEKHKKEKSRVVDSMKEHIIKDDLEHEDKS